MQIGSGENQTRLCFWGSIFSNRLMMHHVYSSMCRFASSAGLMSPISGTANISSPESATSQKLNREIPIVIDPRLVDQ